MNRTTGPRGLALIKSFEGCKLESYRCPAGIPTIGYGHTGPDVTDGMSIPQRMADQLLAQDLRRFEKAINELVLVPLTQCEFDALVAFVYNVGIGAFTTSTMRALLNKHDLGGAALEFQRWNKAGGKPLPGLTRRRAAERALFETDDD